MKKFLTTPLAAMAFVAALAGAAAAAPATAPSHDDTRNVSISHTTTPAPQPTDESGIDRTFHPDYTNALTVEQMEAAWNAEINRVFETPIAGGG
jgi:ABC-type glycerol-3-phosphate transport system substrate-binding protein